MVFKEVFFAINGIENQSFEVNIISREVMLSTHQNICCLKKIKNKNIFIAAEKNDDNEI